MRARLPLALALAAVLIASRARAGDADDSFSRGLQALKRKDARAAVDELENARACAPQRADVVYQLARAYELASRASDAILYYAEASRLDPAGIGKAARADEERLRAKWLRIELEAADEDLETQRFRRAREGYLRAFEIAGPGRRKERTRAREGYARAGAGEFAAAALKDRPRGVKVALLPVPGSDANSALGETVLVLEGELVTAFRAQGASIVGSATASAANPATEAAIVVRGTAGQRIVLSAEDAAGGGAAFTRTTLQALVEGKGTGDLAPEEIALELSIEAQRRNAASMELEKIAVTDRAALRSDDQVRIRARLSCEAHLYVLIFDSRGEATLIYPGTEKLFPQLARAGVKTPNPVPGKRNLVIPPLPTDDGEPFWFTLDRNTGTETFYVAASLEPLEDIEALVREIKKAGEAGRAAAKKLSEALRDRASATRVHEGGASHLELIRGRGAVVRYVSFEHR